MRICFLQKNAMANFGVMSIAGYLKKVSRHESFVVIDSLEKRTIDEIRKTNPDIIGISVVSSEHQWLIRFCKEIKNSLPDTPIIIGGVHAIMYPEILSETEADLLCKSEGEIVLEKILNILSENNDLKLLSDIPSLVYRKNMSRSGELIQNQLMPLLTEIEWEDDASIYYDRYPVLAKDEMKQFLSQRGCPYNCYFCYNSLIKQALKGTGKYLRRKKPELFINEIKWLVDRYGAKSVSIYDDLFTHDKKWLSEFTSLYKEKIGIPYLCQIRADHADEETVAMLSDSGCFTSCVGLESGNEKLRYEVLNKRIPDEKMFYVADLLRKYNINIKTGNMFGIPGETIEQAFETIELNIKIGTKFLGAGMLLPFPGTIVEEIALKKGWLDKPLDYKNLPVSAYDESIFKAPHIEILTNIMNVAQLCAFYPKLLPVMRKFVHVRFRRLFKFIHFSTLTIRFVRERNLGLLHGIAFLWRFRKSL